MQSSEIILFFYFFFYILSSVHILFIIVVQLHCMPTVHSFFLHKFNVSNFFSWSQDTHGQVTEFRTGQKILPRKTVSFRCLAIPVVVVRDHFRVFQLSCQNKLNTFRK